MSEFSLGNATAACALKKQLSPSIVILILKLGGGGKLVRIDRHIN
jgi:hypothetical protein